MRTRKYVPEPLNGMAQYILDENHIPVFEPDIIKVMEWHYVTNLDQRTVAKEMVGDIQVSTVFFGMVIQLTKRVPDLFQTVLFRGEQASERLEWDTWEHAELGHVFVVTALKRYLEEVGDIPELDYYPMITAGRG